MKRLPTRRARALLRAMRDRHVLVVGDVMLDEFVWGRVGRISPEAPVPVVRIEGHSDRPGGAANVARNVRALGGTASLVGLAGDDGAARRLRAGLEADGISGGQLVEAPGRPTTVKTRIIAHHQQVVRTDREAGAPPGARLEAALARAAAVRAATCDAVVVSDYDKGVVSRRVMRAVVAAARRGRLPVLVDPKVRHFGLYRGADLVTPNQAEAEQAAGRTLRTDADLDAVGRRLSRQLGGAAVLVTRGEHGMTLFPRDGMPLHFKTSAREVFDVTGAGDTVIATLGLAVAAGATLAEAAELANLAAGIVVGKLGTATATIEELREALEAR